MNGHAPGAVRCELMRIFARPGHLPWIRRGTLLLRSLAYTNHTLLPEALEKWPVAVRNTDSAATGVIYEINRRFLDDVRRRYPAYESACGVSA